MIFGTNIQKHEDAKLSSALLLFHQDVLEEIKA
jgi:hypothetical protein